MAAVDVSCCAPIAADALSEDQAEQLAPAFKALGDPVRLRLLSMIAARRGEVCVCDLTEAFAVTGPTISHHLRVLREVGLIQCERRGTWVYYWLEPGVLSGLGRLLGVDGAGVAP
jgi:ArsR family transcriptional regulator, arsenate/arsenite/antimonite-responsive transcriptional repressor